MELKPIRTEAEHAEALADIERLWDAPEGSPEADRLEVLAMLVEAYEKAHFPIEAPDPVAFLEYVMDVRGLTRKDLEPYIGQSGRVSEVLNRKRSLGLRMVKRLHDGLKIPYESLLAGVR